MFKPWHILFIVVPFAVTLSQVRYFESGRSGIGLNFAYALSSYGNSSYYPSETSSSSIGFQGGYYSRGYFGFGVILSRSSDNGTMFYGGFIEGALLETKYFDLNLSSSYQTGEAEQLYYSYSNYSVQTYQYKVRVESIAASLEFNSNIIPIDYEHQRDFGFGIVMGPTYLIERIKGSEAEEYLAITFGVDLKMYLGRITLILTPAYSAVLDRLRPKTISFGISIADDLR